jgi:PAS domain S-box-containing protein
MKQRISHSRQENALRMQADKILAEQGGANKKLSDRDAAELLSDLQTHQIELEMKNEELSEARQNIEEAKSKYAELYDFAPVGYFILDEQGVILEANLTGSAMLGVERSLLHNTPFTSHVARGSQDLFYFHRQQIFRKRENHRCEIALVQNGGTPWYVLLESVPVADSTGEVRYCRTVVTDITGRRQAEESCRASEERFRSVMEQVNDSIYITDGSGVIKFWNRKSEELFGYTADEVLGRQHYILLPERARESHVKWLQRFYAGEIATLRAFGEGIVVCKDGTELCVETSLTPLQQGDEKYFVGINRDITERKVAEAETLKAIKAYRALSACNKAVLRAHDEEELLCEATRIVHTVCEYRFAWIGLVEHDDAKTVRAAAQAGFDEGYLETAHITWDDSERGQGPTGSAIRTGKPAIIENIMTDQSFAPWREEAIKRGYVSAAAVPLCNGAENLGALTVYATTAVAFTGEEMVLLHELADNLAYGIASLRRSKKQVQLESRLLQAQKLEAIGTLAGGIAHDFNNILAAIMGNAEMVQQILPPDSTAYQHLNQVLKSSNRAKNLVKQILAFSRKSEEDKQPLEIKKAVEEVVKMLRSTLPATIEIQEHIVSNAWIMGNVTQMHQVLLNLCTNAFHAMREKGGVLGIDVGDLRVGTANARLYHDLTPGDYVRLSITDTGTGIGPKIMNRIFDPFFTTKKVGEGTGLGLSVVHGIIKDSRGDITVESTPGKGTSFHVLLPRIKPRAAQKEKTAQPVPGGTEQILLVDDEDVIVDVAQKLLGMLGYRVTGALSPAEALEIFNRRPDAFDLVITDYTMPKMNGCELAKKLMAVRPDIPVILCTGYNETISEVTAKNRGIREFLFKPLNLRQLGESVRRVLDDKEIGFKDSRVQGE